MKPGDKPRDRPTVDIVRPLIAHFKAQPGNSCGGALHVITDDPNYRDSDIQWAIAHAAKRRDRYAAFVGLVLLRMTKTQRRNVT